MRLSKIGECLFNAMQNVEEHNSYCKIPLFVIMPNHFHAIVFIDGEKTPHQTKNTNTDGTAIATDTATVLTADATTAATIAAGQSTNEKMKIIRSKKGWLSVAVGSLKAAVTKFARENNIDFAWIPRFDDHIIRNQEEMNRVADYIEYNVARWNDDCFNDFVRRGGM
jgi:REP element-mobilizing transposase RayT